MSDRVQSLTSIAIFFCSDEFEAMADQNREFIAVDENRFEQAVRDLEERYGQQIEQLRIEVAQLKQEKAVLAQERDLAKNEAIEAMEKGGNARSLLIGA